MEKNKVIAVLVPIDGDQVVHYIKGIENVREMFLKLILRDMTVSFDTLKDYMLENINLNSKGFIPFETVDEKFGFYLKRMNEKVDWHSKNMPIGSCSEGAITFESFEMTDEEFANPTGELMSPYAFDYLEKGEEPKRSKYSFKNPITGKIVFKDEGNISR